MTYEHGTLIQRGSLPAVRAASIPAEAAVRQGAAAVDYGHDMTYYFPDRPNLLLDRLQVIGELKRRTAKQRPWRPEPMTIKGPWR